MSRFVGQRFQYGNREFGHLVIRESTKRDNGSPTPYSFPRYCLIQDGRRSKMWIKCSNTKFHYPSHQQNRTLHRTRVLCDKNRKSTVFVNCVCLTIHSSIGFNVRSHCQERIYPLSSLTSVNRMSARKCFNTGYCILCTMGILFWVLIFSWS